MLSAVFDALPNAVVALDHRSRIVDCNAKACSLFGYRREELLDRNIRVLLAGSSRDAQILLDKATPEPNLDDLAWRGKGGAPVLARARRQDLVSPDGGQVWLWVESVAAEHELAEASRRLHDYRESERLCLARELHDGAVQELISMGFSLAEIQRQIHRSWPQVDLAPLVGLKADVVRVVRLLRSLVSELRPAGLEEFGLRDTLEGLVHKMVRDHSADHLEVRLEVQEISELTSPQELCLFRTAQEALHNCIKHAQARTVTISVRRVDDQALLIVKDDGCGFDVPAYLSELTRTQHYGLAGMAERVQLVNGQLSVHSRPRQGTEVRVALTLEAPCAL